MDSFEQFRQQLRDALMHLHDPDYQPSELLYAVMGRDPGNGAGAVQSDIIQVIKNLEPPPGVPPGARARRDFDLLHHRFVLKLTQEETAERMSMSVRSVRRAQRAATHVLARLFWEHSLAREVSVEGLGGEKEARSQEMITSDTKVLDWRSQVKQELASLQMGAPGVVADVGETINRVVELESVLTSRRGFSLKVRHVQANLVAAIHPSALRQILVMAIGQLARCTLPGQITIHAALEDEHVRITLTGPTGAGDGLPNGALIREILASQGGGVEVGIDNDYVSFQVKVPAVGKVTVLVVDDNLDQVHFYRRCTTGTRYRIAHAAQGQRTVETVKAIVPDVIVLDIMLPDVDGWELLADLYRDPATRSIPVIVCSIVKEEHLASALGAALYLPKPVQYREFIQALDRVLDQVVIGAPRIGAHSAATC